MSGATFQGRHGHADPDGEWYGMPSSPCSRCKRQCCVDCATRRVGGLLCHECQSWLSLSAEERRERAR